jgi:hypothetical protein
MMSPIHRVQQIEGAAVRLDISLHVHVGVVDPGDQRLRRRVLWMYGCSFRTLATASAVLHGPGRARLIRLHISDDGLPTFIDVDVLDANGLMCVLPTVP